MTDRTPVSPPHLQDLERKIRLTRWVVFFERLWPRLWLVTGVVFLFGLVSLLGVWPLLGDGWHKAALGLFALAAAGALVLLARTEWPGRAEALRRLEEGSGVLHRPASSYEDTLSPDQSGAVTVALWEAHRRWLVRTLDRLRVSTPHPRVDRFDPFALRVLLILTVLLLGAFAGEGISDRLLSAFRFHSLPAAPLSRLDAWIAPPAYTGKAPFMLLDGGRPAGTAGSGGGEQARDVPERSVLTVRASGQGSSSLALVLSEEDGTSRRIAAKPAGSTAATGAPGSGAAGPPAASGGAGASPEVFGVDVELVKQATVTVMVSGVARASWDFAPIRDTPPRIALTEEPGQTARGALKLTYRVEDDYGVTSAHVRFAKPPPKASDPARAWARVELKGPRLPLERPPQPLLRLPRSNAKEAEGYSYIESGAHPWAGIEVTMTLEAKDLAGQTGRSAPVTLVLPSRRFEKPLARAVIEQRRKLVEDSRYRSLVLTALEGLTLEPEGFIDDPRVYLGLRSAYYRLRNDRTRSGLSSVIGQLWHIALRIEDGDLSEAERALRDIQEKLSKALEDGASDGEIKSLMDELREALSRYMEQLAKQAGTLPEGALEGLNGQARILSQQDLDRMMRDIENMARNGSREQAQQMLSELRDFLENMQVGRMSEEQMRQSRRMMELMNELGGLAGDQQKLMDDTFSEQRRREEGAGGSRNGEQDGGATEPGHTEPGRGGGRQDGAGKGGGLQQRQSGLRQRLDDLRRELERGGLGNPPGQLGDARDAMERAERALGEGDYAAATEEQARALDELRQGAQAMAQQMLRAAPQRYGRSGSPADTLLDPLSRPQRADGPDIGEKVKVPDEIDMQRAREILEELRRRLGDTGRPSGEIDYIERLLRRY